MYFSIIVPIYNVEKYVVECIESVLNQKFPNFELLLIDDGSTDKSGVICDFYSKKDNRVVVIHKENGGLSDARNAGLNIANGKYIVFLDGDDFLEEDILQDLFGLNSRKHADIITCTMTEDYGDNNKTRTHLNLAPLSEIINREHLYSELCRTSGSYWSAGRNVYRFDIIKKYNLRFKKNLIGAEDCDFFMRYTRLSDSFIFFDKPLINYRKNRIGSITNTMSKSAILGQLYVFSDNFYIYEKSSTMQIYLSEKFANTVSLLPHLSSPQDIIECENFIVKNKNILTYTKKKKYLVANFIWSLLGYYKGSSILKEINKILNNSYSFK